jgi:hypothetical protein
MITLCESYMNFFFCGNTLLILLISGNLKYIKIHFKVSYVRNLPHESSMEASFIYIVPQLNNNKYSMETS